MLAKFFRFTILSIFCLSLTGKMLLEDSCAGEVFPKIVKSSPTKNINNSSDHAAKDCCSCHCHHHHFDLAIIANHSNIATKTIATFAYDSSSLLPLHFNLPARPPKIVS